jgi:hypothetical protein
MPREAIVKAWQKSTASADSVSPNSVLQLIEEIVAKEFPMGLQSSHVRMPKLG